jgi:UDP:flavonoid glycosyltransferase YjiC (YdhE family)
LADDLRRRGHEVAFVTDVRLQEFLDRAGHRRFERSDPDGPSFQVDTWFHPISIAMQVKHIARALKAFAPDVLIGQSLTLGPLIAADCFHLPVAILGQLTYLFPSALDRCLPPAVLEKSEIYPRGARRLWREAEFISQLNGAREILRMRKVALSDDLNPLLGHLYMVRSVRALESDIDMLPAEVHLVGPCTWEDDPVDPQVDDWIQGTKKQGRSLLYVQQGRTFGKPGFWAALMKIVSQMPVAVIASVGRTDQQRADVPPNVFLKAHVPQAQVLGSAAAVIANGNSAVTIGALSAGVPALLVPEGGEQLDVAEVCENAGLAEVWNDRVGIDGAALRSRILRLLDDESLRRRAQDFSVLFKCELNWESAAELVETLVQTKQRVVRPNGSFVDPAVLHSA